MTSENEELVQLVDQEDRPIGTAPRSRMRAENLRHRASFVLVRSSDGRVFAHRRTTTKDVYPGRSDVFFGGVAGAGESYEEAAVRELSEEAGITGVPLRFLFRVPYEDERSRLWAGVYEVTWDGPVTLQAEEVAWGDWVTVERAIAMLDEDFVPDGAQMFRRWLAQTAAG